MRPARARRKFGVALLAGLLALAGCADPGATPAACVLEPVARVPVALMNGLPIVEATIAGGPVRLVLDTGAERTLLTDAAVRRLGLRRDTRRATRTAGLGGMSAAFDAVTDSITLGNATLPLADVSVGRFSLGRPDMPIDGLLGGDVWRRFDVDLDLPARVATLYRAQPCHRAAPPWPGGAIAIEGLEGRPNRLLLPAALDGVPAVAVFDTGSQVTGVSARLAARTNTPAGPARDVRMRGANAGISSVPARQFASLRIGPLLFADPVLPIIPLPPFVGDVLVGEDMVRGCRAWFSFAAHQVFLAPPGASPQPGGQIMLACPRTSP